MQLFQEKPLQEIGVSALFLYRINDELNQVSCITGSEMIIYFPQQMKASRVLFSIVSVIIFFVFILGMIILPGDSYSSAKVKQSAKSVVTSSYSSSPHQIIQSGIPVRISIPKIDLTASIVSMDLTAEKIVDTPPDDVGWYAGGARPGNPGTCALNGHFLNLQGNPGVFFNLSKLQIGDNITITDDKKQQFRYKITNTELVDLDNFSAQKVYASGSKSLLSLVTCAGNFNTESNNYTKRTVIYAELVS